MYRAPNGNTYYWCRKYWGNTCYAIKYKDKKYLVVKYSLVKGRLRQTVVEACHTVYKAEKLVINADVGNPKDQHIENTPHRLFATLSYIKENKQLCELVGVLRSHKKFVRNQRKYRKEHHEYVIGVNFDAAGYNVHIHYHEGTKLFVVTKLEGDDDDEGTWVPTPLRTYKTIKGAENFLVKNFVPEKEDPDITILRGPVGFIQSWWDSSYYDAYANK